MDTLGVAVVLYGRIFSHTVVFIKGDQKCLLQKKNKSKHFKIFENALPDVDAVSIFFKVKLPALKGEVPWKYTGLNPANRLAAFIPVTNGGVFCEIITKGGIL